MNKEILIEYRKEIRIAALFVLLGLIAIFMGDPYKKPELKVSFTDIEQILKQRIEQISPIDLAEFIIKPTEAYRLIDLRSITEFQEYKIPGAERVALEDLVNHGLIVNERIFLYTTKEHEAVQAYFILNMQSFFKLSIVSGGMKQWKSDVLYPHLNAESPNVDHRKQISKFFGGKIDNTRQVDLDSLILPKPIYIQKPALDPESCG